MARRTVRAASSGAILPPATARAETSQRDVPADFRFMEGFEIQRAEVHRGDEPRASVLECGRPLPLSHAPWLPKGAGGLAHSKTSRQKEPFIGSANAGRGRGASVPSAGSRGVALVITLILLAVIATLAIAFLALTYRETASVDAMGRTTDAELAADSALEMAKAEILAPFPRRNSDPNPNGSEILGPDFMVSVNSQSFDDTNRLDPTNMFFNPSPPVFVDTNRGNTTGPLEDRFYVDLNRNRIFEETGFQPVLDDNFRPVGLLTNWVVGDPHWVGILQRPGQPHLSIF